jgi:6-phosphogluconolactonase (cycloisomerase 2 family)
LAAAGLLAIATGAAAGGSISVLADEGNNNEGDAAGHVYVNDNTAGINTVAAFDRGADGSLTPIEGSPFAAGGAGTGKGIGSQGGLQVSSDRRYLLVADAGSNQISVLRIRSDGSLQAVDGSPVSSGGTSPVTIAIHGNLVFIGNNGAVSNYTGFTLNRGGHLRPVADSTFSLPSGTQIGDVLFNRTGRNLVGTRVGTGVGAANLPSEIDSFAVTEDGHLVPAPGSPSAAQGAGPFGSEFRPTNSSQLFVSNAHDGANNGTVSAYHVSGDGTLNSINGSPFKDEQTAPCWVEITHDGRFLFTVNTAVPSISRFSIAGDGSLELLGSTPFNTGKGLGPTDARLAPQGGTLWVVDGGRPGISAFAVDGGNLTELGSSPTPLPAGAAPFGIVVI